MTESRRLGKSCKKITQLKKNLFRYINEKKHEETKNNKKKIRISENVAQVIYPLLCVVFATLYWIIGMLYYCSSF